MKFLFYLVVSLYVGLNTSHAMLPGLQRALVKIKREDKKSAIEIIKELTSVPVDGEGNYNIADTEGNKEYAKILLKFILTGQLDDEKGETLYHTRISKKHFATEEERDILSTAILKTACIDLSLERFIEDVIAKETEPYTKKHQKVVLQLFHLAGLMIKEPYIYNFSLFVRFRPEFRPFYYDDIQNDPIFKGINEKKFNMLFKKNKIWIDRALELLDSDTRAQNEILQRSLIKNVKHPAKDNLAKEKEYIPRENKPISEEMEEEYKEYLKINNGLFAGWNVWCPIVPPQRKVNDTKQGWKLHVSATPNGALRVAKAVVPYLKEHKIETKIAGSLKFLKNLGYSKGSIAQRGKFITIYPEDNENSSENNDNAAKIARDLNDLLMNALENGTISKEDFEVIPYDAQLGESGGLYTRYGLFEIAFYVKPVDSKGNKIEGKWTFDNRERYYKPDFVTWNPFGDLLQEPQGY